MKKNKEYIYIYIYFIGKKEKGIYRERKLINKDDSHERDNDNAIHFIIESLNRKMTRMGWLIFARLI